MSLDLALFVSKRLTAVAAGLLCLVAAQLVRRVAGRAAQAASATEVRVAIRR